MTQLRTGLRRALGVVAVVALLGMPEGIVAEQVQGGVSSMAPGGLLEDGAAPPPGPETRTFGTTSTVAHTIQAFDFRTLTQAQGFTAAGLNGALACATTAGSLAAPVFLPAGAVVLFVEGELCDADPANDMTVNFFRVTTPGPTTVPPCMATSERTSVSPRPRPPAARSSV